MADLPKRGERVTIRWPNGPYDFEIEYIGLNEAMPRAAEGWYWVRGLVVKPEGVRHRTAQTFMVQPVDGGYALLPKIKP
jgi:hypothetical protein